MERRKSTSDVIKRKKEQKKIYMKSASLCEQNA